MPSLKRTVLGFMTMTESQVLDRFEALPGARRNSGDHWVFIEGTRDPADRLLLMAHADTVQGQMRYDTLCYTGDFIYGPYGCGADDRAGCAAVWKLRDLGHSILVTTGEEVGGIGAYHAARNLEDVLGRHAIAFQVDRAGSDDVALYPGTYSGEFEKYLAEKFPGWTQSDGTYTDVATISPAVGICGANLAAGYMWEHTNKEVLSVAALGATINSLRRLCLEAEYPVMLPDKVESWYNYPTLWVDDDDDDGVLSWKAKKVKSWNKVKSWKKAKRRSVDVLDEKGARVGSTTDCPAHLYDAKTNCVWLEELADYHLVSREEALSYFVA